ncbi:unnamed protein product [[Candida] boidinii]|uniref:Unnamed protein product n=1 Tax=Candida boidinii TaxID=5477 RepID=A0A9W6SV75_CANBO|nr:glutamate decarboxylase activity protein [[Candida] boidinii]GME66936.1 unnamed protein product [[Candida] boidinii]GMG00058.1 unnamed protein product [[Candida] boidinii]
MTFEKIQSNLESNRAQELEDIILPAIQKIVEQVRDTDAGKADIGPRFENPKELYSILKLDDPKIFDKPLQGKPNDVVAVFDSILKNSVNTWHPGFMDKLYASTNPIGLLSDILLSTLNTNSHVFTVSPALTIIERFVSRKYANLFGFTDANAGGLTFSGGSWSNITSLHMARSILFPETKLSGNSNKNFVVFTSVHSHYSVEKACILLGLGADAMVKIPVDSNGRMKVDILENKIVEAINSGKTPLYINGTAGTTVFGSYDPFEEISVVAKKYKLWFHIDGSWGGNSIFSETKRKYLKGSHLADSITSNPHKMLGVPTTCSFLLVPNERVFQQANSLAAPYLFHNTREEDENFDLADGTMGCGRRADSLKFYLGWLYYGTEGYAKRVDHAYAIGEYFAKKINKIPGFHLISDIPPPCLQICFYYNPKLKSETLKFEDIEGSDYTKTTRYIATKLHSTGKFLVDYAPNPDDALTGNNRGEFFRVVFNSPIINSDIIDNLIDDIINIGSELQ